MLSREDDDDDDDDGACVVNNKSLRSATAFPTTTKNEYASPGSDG